MNGICGHRQIRACLNGEFVRLGPGHGTLFHGAKFQEVRHVRRLRIVRSKEGRLPFDRHRLPAACGEPPSPRLARPDGQELRRSAVPIV